MTIQFIQCGICGQSEAPQFYICTDCSEVYCEEHVPPDGEECPCQETEEIEETP